MLQTRCAAGNRGGFFCWDTATGTLYWEIDKLDTEFLYQLGNLLATSKNFQIAVALLRE